MHAVSNECTNGGYASVEFKLAQCSIVDNRHYSEEAILEFSS